MRYFRRKMAKATMTTMVMGIGYGVLLLTFLYSKLTSEHVKDETSTSDIQAEDSGGDDTWIRDFQAEASKDDDTSMIGIQAALSMGDKTWMSDIHAEESRGDDTSISDIQAELSTGDKTSMSDIQIEETRGGKRSMKDIQTKESRGGKRSMKGIQAKESRGGKSSIKDTQAKESRGDKTSIKDIQAKFHRWINRMDYDCKNVTSVGNFQLCSDPAYRPTTGKCLVYSFGIKQSWEFDEAMADKFDCEVHSFDPSVGLADHKHAPNIHFHNVGVSDSDYTTKDGWELKSLSSIIKMLSHEDRTIDVMKMNIEGSEWPTLGHFVGTDLPRQVRQISMQAHAPRNSNDYEWQVAGYKIGDVTPEDFAKINGIFSALQKQGFQKYSAIPRSCCQHFSVFVSSERGNLGNGKRKICCYEVSFVNSK